MAFERINDVTLALTVDGNPSGMTLAFVNSLGSDYRMWDALVPHFKEDYTVVLHDKRGHGLSDCPPAPYRIRAFSEDLAGVVADERVVVVGISVGGMIAMDFAATQPEKVAALVLLDTFPKIGTAAMWNERIDTLREHGMAHLGDAILARWFAPSYQAANPAGYRGYYNMLTRTPIDGYTGTCEAIRDADLTGAAKGITCPTLVLCGAEDGATPPELVRGLTEIIPDARYVEIAGAGHLPPVEKPQATAEAIHEFLQEVL